MSHLEALRLGLESKVVVEKATRLTQVVVIRTLLERVQSQGRFGTLARAVRSASVWRSSHLSSMFRRPLGMYEYHPGTELEQPAW